MWIIIRRPPLVGGHQAGEAKVRVFQSFQSVFATGLPSLLALVPPGVVDLSLFVRYPPPKVPPGPKNRHVCTPGVYPLTAWASLLPGVVEPRKHRKYAGLGTPKKSLKYSEEFEKKKENTNILNFGGGPG